MNKFTPRFTKPAINNKCYINYKYGGYNTCIVLDSANGNVLPNCVGYAHGRLLELGGEKKVNWFLPACNAEDWLEMAKGVGMRTGMEPKLGAVIVWAKGKLKNGSDGAGHVAVVEQINADGSIITSESGYKSASYFWTKTRKNDGNWGQSSSYRFLGFIYCDQTFDGIETKPSTDTYVNLDNYKVTLKDTPCYSSSSAKEPYTMKSGKFFYWDNKVVNGRIRITNKAEYVGVSGCVTCWIDAPTPQVNEIKPRTPFLVKVKVSDLDIYTGPGSNYKKTGKYTKKGTFTIVEEKEGPGAGSWGKLKSGAGWIAITTDTTVMEIK